MNVITKLRRKRWIYITRRRIKSDVKAANRRKDVRLNIGCGERNYGGWINLDLPAFDATNKESWTKLIGSASVQFALFDHVLEHLTENQIIAALSLLKERMEVGATVRIAVPDKNHPNPAYIEAVRPGGSGPGADDHKTFWDIDSFSKMATNLGFEVKPIEYYTANGELVMNEMDPNLGIITRTARKPRKGELSDYSSLILDLKK